MDDFLETAPNQKNMVGEDVGGMTLGSVIKDPKTLQLLGLVIIGFSAYTMLSYVSYWINMFVGNSDQALVIGKSWNWLKINNPIIDRKSVV